MWQRSSLPVGGHVSTAAYGRKELNRWNSSGAGNTRWSHVTSSIPAHGNVLSPVNCRVRTAETTAECGADLTRAICVGGRPNSRELKIHPPESALADTHCNLLDATEGNSCTYAYWEEYFWSPHLGKRSTWCSDNWICWVRISYQVAGYPGRQFLVI
jgi:hypothetical protein